jgi:signal transduction histidine kinase
VDRFTSTLKALVVPRRFVPIVAVVAAFTGVQLYYMRDAITAVIPLGMSAGFVLVMPFAWRALLAPGRPLAPRIAWTIYTTLALAIVGLFGVALPFVIGPTFLTDEGSLVVALILILIGGWGLGRDIELELDLEHAQLKAIRTHLDPHFLFNTLNAIAEWCAEDPKVAEDATLRLAALLREVLEGLEQRTWPLARELAVVRDFLELHRVRDREAFTFTLPADASDHAVPPLILLSLVENAVKHGPRKGHRGAIVLRIEHAPRLRVEIENPGPYAPSSDGRGLALVRKRLALTNAQLDIRVLDDNRTLAAVTL